jgi:hypothetical protein
VSLDLLNHHIRKIGKKNHDTFVIQKGGEQEILCIFHSITFALCQNDLPNRAIKFAALFIP